MGQEPKRSGISRSFPAPAATTTSQLTTCPAFGDVYKRYRIDAEKIARKVRDDVAAKAKKKAAKAKKASKAAA